MSKKILIGVLDWGLGHATRCIPLIDYLLQFQCQIFVGASGAQKKLLEDRFPGLVFLDLPPYDIKYPHNARIVSSIGMQLPKLLNVIAEEHRWLELKRLELGLDLVISDNRYGLWLDQIPSIILTHQLSPITGFGNLADNAVRKMHYHYLNKFHECWVPDQAGYPGLAGKLSHPSGLPRSTRYIGPLSRMEPLASTEAGKDLLAVISGPEPARSRFEEKLSGELEHFSGSYLLVRGLPSSPTTPPPNCRNHLEAETLNREMAAASLVIARSGYTTIMDLVRLKKPAVLVPTPGQTEQEYLATHLQEQSVFPFLKQKHFSLEKACSLARQFRYQWPEPDFNGFQKAIQELLDR